MKVEIATGQEEKGLLAGWLETVQFDEESEGIPEMEVDEDDDPDEDM
jgi:hypothetical protein